MKFKLIIPAIDNNKYSKDGDLVKWGGTTLLEWKISQAKKIKNIDEIIISTNSKKIKKISESYNLKTENRYIGKNIIDLYVSIAKKYKNYYLVWLNCTSPFISESTINKFLIKFKNKKKFYDCAFTYHQENEYFLINNKPVNFSLDENLKERKNLRSLKKITNGASILNPQTIIKRKQLIGTKPMFYKIDWLSSLEIKDTNNINSYESLIHDYFSSRS